MGTDLTEVITSIGGGGAGGTILGAFVAKYLVGKSDKEIEQIKAELAMNKDADSLRDTAIELLKLEMASHKDTASEIKQLVAKLDEKIEKRFDQILDKLNK